MGIVESVHKSIFWTPCVCHTFNLALKDLCDPTEKDVSRFQECNWIKELIGEACSIKIFVANHSQALTIYDKYFSLRLLSIGEKKRRMSIEIHQFFIPKFILY
ncbi:hypothetical protein GIB67_013619 [Kingdonia uniflora]|uniref:DUF659 domain-containing protein n=1 Tax=Kingdonia uniflora TaxID=39325 RepID=A0A7J7NPT9_9MAGN|nr:hypothetical protein GIB67_013619 [Kingdonia uniflora]